MDRNQKVAHSLLPVPFASYAASWANSNLPASSRVLFISQLSSFYYQREGINDDYYGPTHLTRILTRCRSVPELTREFRRLGITHLHASEAGVEGYLGIPDCLDVPAERWAIWKEFLRLHTEPVWQTNDIAVFRLTVQPFPRPLIRLPVLETLVFHAADRALHDGRTAEALGVYRHPPPLLADVGSTMVRTGNALMALNDPTSAESAYRRALQIGVRTPELLRGLAHAIAGQGRASEAIPFAVDAATRHPLSASAAATVGSLCLAANRLVEAEVWLTKAVRLRPDEPEYSGMLSTIRSRLQSGPP